MKRIIYLLAFLLLPLLLKAQYQDGVKVELLLQTDTTVLGQKLMYPQTDNAEFTMCKVIVPPGKQTGWHKHMEPVFAYMLEGDLMVELKDGTIYHYAPNETISEVFNVYHNGYNKGNKDAVLIAVYLGVKGVPLSEKMK